ncbi:zinc finger CCCH domain-containing protein 3-like [Helianthus annuus]|uniref:zinc finger CCCH domain-containing protein 3-like n=1 Tax=Helianthus annuus TaxID=4232 RepID=UPI000B8F3B36|nr:zinc finger CCCH domain-containing protein 3-like [Helianthus annuus]
MASSTNDEIEASPMQKKDCFFFVEYGSCSFGKNCNYNHPSREDSQVRQEGSAEIVYPNYTRRIPCKFFRAGYCKYGIYCGFSHSMPPPPMQYNSDGLPMRLGEHVCAHYVSYRSCGYGAGCKFHHPELNYSVPQEYGPQAFGQAQAYHDGTFESNDILLGSTDEEFLPINE